MKVIRWLAGLGLRPVDDDAQRLRKSSIALTAGGISMLMGAWIAAYMALGRPEAAAIPLLYQGVSVVGLFHLARTKSDWFIRPTQRMMSLLLPFALQWVLGGYTASGATALWAFLAPAGALMFDGPRQAVVWFAAWVALAAVSGAAEPWASGWAVPMPAGIRAAFWVLNLVCPTGIVFSILLKVDHGRTTARHALEREHRLAVNERDRAEGLLLNILPPSIAARLKDSPRAIADGHPDVTVLFSDVVNFTTLSGKIPPRELVEFLNELFSLMDGIAERHGLEKIKTIGDAYMAVAGLPHPRSDHAEAAAEMALDVRDGLSRLKTPTGHPLRMRVGINTGPVVAGVIGKKKFIYDLWGDAVNLASRMESHGVAGEIHCTEATRRRLAGLYRFEDRGEIEVKGKGKLRTFLLRDRVPRPASG